MENKLFTIKSINMIAYLKTKGIDPSDIKVEDGQVTYYFDNTSELHFYLKEYKKDTHLQNFITKLSSTRKEIKSLI